MFFYSPVYARDVHHYVDHVAAQLVALHVYRAGVGGNIDLGEDVEEEDLLRAAVGSKQVQEALEGAHLRDQALDDLKRNKISKLLFMDFFPVFPGCSAFCLHHPLMAPFGGRGP